MSESNTDGEALNQLQVEQGWLLDKIDELRNIGISGLVDLPQLIVCGNQSSGKSSVLEAISRVRFPVKSNICTRFATEVSLRRHPVTRFKISIEPGPSRATEADRRKVIEFAPEAFTNSDQLPTLIEQAKECMGIESEKGVSDDILKIEISGPHKPELTLVDLPGLYYSTSTNQGAEGIRIARSLTEQYMKNPRSIILATVSAKADYHLQEVLNIAATFDPTRDRTIGIITQPDTLAQHSEDEDFWLQIAKNEKVRLQLGWHVLRNRSFETYDASDDDRDSNEKEFFNRGRWSTVARDCVGIDSLRRRLSGILLKHIRHNLPSLIEDIERKLLDRQTRLAKLGAPRSTLQQQKGFLLALSSNFERITNQALIGMYTDGFFGELGNSHSSPLSDPRRLRAIIRQLNEYFAEAMERIGCKYSIFGANEQKVDFTFLSNPYAPLRHPPVKYRQDLEKEVDQQARQNRGIELPGTANQLLVGSLFRDQSQPWEEIARFHLVRVWETVGKFVDLALQHLTDEHTYQLLLGTILAPKLQSVKEGLLSKLDELTAYNKRGHPLPLGKSFLQRIHKSRADRQGMSLENALGQKVARKDGGYALSDIRSAVDNLGKTEDEFAAAEVIDQMQAYYDTAIITFIDNVATLGIENCLLCPLSGILTSQTINNMEDKQVKDLAGEASFITEERDRLIREQEKLQNSLIVLNQCKIQKKPSSNLFTAGSHTSAGVPQQTVTAQSSKQTAARSNGDTILNPGLNPTLNPGANGFGQQQKSLPIGSPSMRSGESFGTSGVGTANTQNKGLFGGNDGFNKAPNGALFTKR
ncbi:uncharacterized protein N7482_006567 [Penicillium canariense]|uniref:Dynamin family protein n=1 Tax=Penicillium canariense TaxID=189055 RepID=A0A9W9HV96_9EURO|nr:uncharacterized protein N7482_006567 [Penicillium canariense]KAJ5159563.1 hypothetical protein N7482_006567 [Penicillium canariense]